MGFLILLLVIVVGGVGNTFTQFGGVIEDAFVDPDHPARLNNELAEELGFEESISIAYAFVKRGGAPREFDTGDIDHLIDFQENFDNFFLRQREYVRSGKPGLDADVVGLPSYERYGFEDGVSSSSPYLWRGMDEEDIINTKRDLLLDHGVNNGIMVGNDFTYVIFTVLLQPGQSDAVIRDSLTTFLQNGKARAWYQTDIEPVTVNKYAKIYPVGWPFARGWFSKISALYNYFFVGCGLVFFFFLFWGLSRSTLHTITVVVCVYGISFLLLRGSIGIIDELTPFLIRERVFAQLAYALTLVISISMGTHVWEGYIGARRRGASPEDAIMEMKNGVGRVVVKAAIFSIISFSVLALSADLQAMREIGILFILSVVFPWILSLAVLPELIKLPVFVNAEPAEHEGIGILERAFRRVTSVAISWSTVRPSVIVAILVVISSLAYFEFASGGFKQGSNPDRLLGGTYFEQAAAFMNEEGKHGFNDYQVAFECTPVVYGEEPYRNPQCIADVVSITNFVHSIPEVRSVMSLPTGAMRHVSNQRFGKDFPETDKEVDAVFESLASSSLYILTSYHFEWSNGYRVVFFSPDPTPEGLGRIGKAIQDASSKHPGIKAIPFGSDAMWVDFSTDVINNTKRNVPQDLGLLLLIPMGFLYWRWRASNLLKLGIQKRLSPMRIGVIVMLPFLVTTLVMIIVMAELGIPLDIASAAINQMTIGAAVDFLFFPLIEYIELVEVGENHADAMRMALERTGVAVTADGLFNACAFMFLITSGFLVIKLLGILLVVAVVSTWISVMFFVLPLMRWAHIKS